MEVRKTVILVPKAIPTPSRTKWAHLLSFPPWVGSLRALCHAGRCRTWTRRRTAVSSVTEKVAQHPVTWLIWCNTSSMKARPAAIRQSVSHWLSQRVWRGRHNGCPNECAPRTPTLDCWLPFRPRTLCQARSQYLRLVCQNLRGSLENQSCPIGASGCGKRGGDWDGQALEIYRRPVSMSCNPRTSTVATGLHDLTDLISTRTAADRKTLNVGECMVTQRSFGKRVPPSPPVLANGSIVFIVNSITLLGITLSPSLEWDQHLEE